LGGSWLARRVPLYGIPCLPVVRAGRRKAGHYLLAGLPNLKLAFFQQIGEVDDLGLIFEWCQEFPFFARGACYEFLQSTSGGLCGLFIAFFFYMRPQNRFYPIIKATALQQLLFLCNPPTFYIMGSPTPVYLIYKAAHSQCNKFLKMPDYRVKDIKTFNELKNNFHPLSLYCNVCMHKVAPTLVDIYLSEKISAKPAIEDLPISNITELDITKLILSKTLSDSCELAGYKSGRLHRSGY
jgi:hypothetical protein